jgi:superoxide dismutase, Fe-Mn family
MAKHTLPELPWGKDALAPVISAETIDFHYGKHHQAYVNNLNGLIEGTPYADLALDAIVKKSVNQASEQKVFNNAAQIWNHTFYWNCLSPKGGGAPTGKAAQAIEKSFGDFNKFKEKLSADAAALFGSGWTWVVKEGDGIAIVNLPNAGTPMAEGKTCLLTIDVWEHAYYIDYRNARPKYIEEFWKLVKWDYFNANLG